MSVTVSRSVSWTESDLCAAFGSPAPLFAGLAIGSPLNPHHVTEKHALVDDESMIIKIRVSSSTPIPSPAVLPIDSSITLPEVAPRPVKAAKCSPMRSCLKRATAASVKPAIRFSPAVKVHDGLRPASKLFDVLFYLRIGGMSSCQQFVEYLISECAAHGFGDFRVHYDQVERSLADLLARIGEAGCVPVLPGGGGSNSKIGPIALPNLEHLAVVMKETRKKVFAAPPPPPVLPVLLPSRCGEQEDVLEMSTPIAAF